ncbi:hypothetical protein ROZALSC1DRAFT_28160, partial [Rozella allomycis CSF55]
MLPFSFLVGLLLFLCSARANIHLDPRFKLKEQKFTSLGNNARDCYQALLHYKASSKDFPLDCAEISLSVSTLAGMTLKSPKSIFDGLKHMSVDDKKYFSNDIVNLYMFFAMTGKLAVVKHITENHYKWIYSVSSKGLNVMSMASVFNRVDVVSYLLEIAKKQYLAQNISDEWVFRLLDESRNNCMDYAIKLGHAKVIEALIKSPLYNPETYKSKTALKITQQIQREKNKVVRDHLITTFTKSNLLIFEPELESPDYLFDLRPYKEFNSIYAMYPDDCSVKKVVSLAIVKEDVDLLSVIYENNPRFIFKKEDFADNEFIPKGMNFDHLNGLQLAILLQRMNVIDFFIEHKKYEMEYVSLFERTPFFYAVLSKNIEILKLLANHSEKNRYKPYFTIMDNRGTDIVEEFFLLKQPETIYELAHVDIIPVLGHNSFGYSLLDYSIYYGFELTYYSLRRAYNARNVEYEMVLKSRPNGINLLLICLITGKSLTLCKDIYAINPDAFDMESLNGITVMSIVKDLTPEFKYWVEQINKERNNLKPLEIEMKELADEFQDMTVLNTKISKSKAKKARKKARKITKAEDVQVSIPLIDDFQASPTLIVPEEPKNKTKKPKTKTKQKQNKKKRTSQNMIEKVESERKETDRLKGEETVEIIFPTLKRKKLRPKRSITGKSLSGLQIKPQKVIQDEYFALQEKYSNGEIQIKLNEDEDFYEPDLVDFIVTDISRNEDPAEVASRIVKEKSIFEPYSYYVTEHSNGLTLTITF